MRINVSRSFSHRENGLIEFTVVDDVHQHKSQVVLTKPFKNVNVHVHHEGRNHVTPVYTRLTLTVMAHAVHTATRTRMYVCTCIVHTLRPAMTTSKFKTHF